MLKVGFFEQMIDSQNPTLTGPRLCKTLLRAGFFEKMIDSQNPTLHRILGPLRTVSKTL